MNVPARTKARFALLTFGRLLLGAVALFRSAETYRSDALPWKPLPSLGFFLLGLLLLWWGVVGARALLRGDTPAAQTLVAGTIAEVDRRAPSGLKPLWIALLAILGVFVGWALISNLIGAS
jgi:hypothetical protein